MSEFPSGVKVRWRILLPAFFSALAAGLMALAVLQSPWLRGRGTGWEVPATVINSLVKGPGFYLGGLFGFIPMLSAVDRALGYETHRLLGIIGFWFLIGLAIERRRDGLAIDQHYPITSLAVFVFCALVCAFLAWAATRNPNISGDWRSTWDLLVEYPLRTTNSIRLGHAIWNVALSLYFVRRAYQVARRRPIASTAS